MVQPVCERSEPVSPGRRSRRTAGGPVIERVQTGVRMEKRMVKVLKGLAEYLDLSLGDLIEGVVLHAFESHHPFGPETLVRIEQLKTVYGMDYTADVSHRLREGPPS